MSNESKLSLLMGSLTEFYQEKKYIDEIKNIVVQNNVISLRILDWFITNYAKKYRIPYIIQAHGSVLPF